MDRKLLLLLPIFCGHLVQGADSIVLSGGPHLFVDDYLIQKHRHLRRTIHPPVRLPAPVVTAVEDGNWQPWFSVLRDPASGRFRIWYNAWDGEKTRLGYLESEDGIHWERPHRFLDLPTPIKYGASVFDEGAGHAYPSKRFKGGWWADTQWLLTSPDGIQWERLAQVDITKSADHNHFIRDPIRKRYLAILGAHSTPEDGYTGKTAHAPEGYRRLVGQTTSPDLVHWEALQRTVVADSKDEGITEFYGIGGVLARGPLLLGMLKVLRDDLPHEPEGEIRGIGYTALTWTWDGEHWERDRLPFLDRSSESGSWDRAMSWVDSQLIVGDEIYLYYGGYAQGHKVNRYQERQIGLARIERDRYVSRDAGSVEAAIQTRLLTLDAERMTLNAKVLGELKVRLLNPRGEAVSGFDWSDCRVIQGNSLAHPVRCSGSLASLRRRPIRLEFALREAELYGFDLW